MSPWLLCLNISLFILSASLHNSCPESDSLCFSVPFSSRIVLVWVLAVSTWVAHLSHPLVPRFAHPLPLGLLQNVPHKTSLPEGVRVGTVMRIRGVVPDKASR